MQSGSYGLLGNAIWRLYRGMWTENMREKIRNKCQDLGGKYGDNAIDHMIKWNEKTYKDFGWFLVSAITWRWDLLLLEYKENEHW